MLIALPRITPVSHEIRRRGRVNALFAFVGSIVSPFFCNRCVTRARKKQIDATHAVLRIEPDSVRSRTALSSAISHVPDFVRLSILLERRASFPLVRLLVPCTLIVFIFSEDMESPNILGVQIGRPTRFSLMLSCLLPKHPTNIH